MTNQSTFDFLSEAFEGSCIELFQLLHCDVCPTQELASISGTDPIGILDAGSNELELAICLQIPFNILASTYPIHDEVANLEGIDYEDWVGELCNQLMGKIKNRLLTQGLRLSIGLPDTYFGSDISELVSEQGVHLVYRFSIDHEIVEATLVVDILEEGLDLRQDPDFDVGPGIGKVQIL